MREIVILGDNIIECERALNFIEASFRAKCPSVELLLIDSAPHRPKYELSDKQFSFELRAGHRGRWPETLISILVKKGAKIVEHFDALVYEVLEVETYEPLIAFEFCSSLPAGNNAWQRLGRALTAIQAGVPYLYFVDAGGYEFDSDRRAKAPPCR
jgi:hypothetical protein